MKANNLIKVAPRVGDETTRGAEWVVAIPRNDVII